MHADDRRQKILEQLENTSLLRVKDLAEQLDVSQETVRRDIVLLDEEGLAQRVYGGVMQANAEYREPSFEDRSRLHTDAKRALAALAVSLIRTDDTLILDVGTTILEVAIALPADFIGRVITNSLRVANELANRPAMTVLLAGGVVRVSDLAISGASAEAFFDHYYADRAFISASGVDLVGGVTEFNPRDVGVRQIAIKRVTEAWVVVDGSKLGRIAFQKVCELTDVAGILTDSTANPEILEELRSHGIKVLVA
jgi:DeoR family fructose operon transcriptional repressor